jgi:hypothetical protein
MGAGESKSEIRKIDNYDTFVSVMDTIASEYILTMNFADMLELQNSEKSKNILILTQDIIMKELEKHDLIYDKKIRDAMGNTKEKEESVIFTATKQELGNLKLNSETHQVLANALAKKYLKIANIFAAIYVVLHPEYETQICSETSKNSSDDNKKRRICKPKNERKSEKKKQMYFMQNKPEGAPIKNFCHKRLQTLIGQGTSELNANSSKGITVAPTVCEFGKNKKTGEPLKFSEEPGILELDALYYDEYDDQTKDFTKRSPAMEKELQRDATALFEAIVGMSLENYNTRLRKRDPQAKNKEIKSFDDITMRTLYNTEGCLPISDNIGNVSTLEELQSSGIGSYRQKFSGDSELFRKYGAHLKEMKENAEKNYLALSSIIEIIFVQSNNSYKIRQGIKETEIDKLLEQTRQLISKMYIQCSKDFRIGISLFKKIVAEAISKQHKKIMEGHKNSVKNAIRLANEKPMMKD